MAFWEVNQIIKAVIWFWGSDWRNILLVVGAIVAFGYCAVYNSTHPPKDTLACTEEHIQKLEASMTEAERDDYITWLGNGGQPHFKECENG